MFEVNNRLATLFLAFADRLATQRANPYRVRAYRRAADSVRALEEDIRDVAGRGELQTITGIGKDLSEKIQEFLATGSFRDYDALNTPLPAEVAAWETLPGFSAALVGYLYYRLGISTLADLDALVRSHMLRTAPGFAGSEEELLAALNTRREAKRDEAP
jgi:DNA polymerase (family 10)